MPSVTLLARSRASTEARVPSERAIASSTSSVACAASSTPGCSASIVRATRRAAAVIGNAVRGTSSVAT